MVFSNIRISLFAAALLLGVVMSPFATDAQPYPYPYYPPYGYSYACPYGYPCDYYPDDYYPYPWNLGVGVDIGGGWGHGGYGRNWGHGRGRGGHGGPHGGGGHDSHH